MKRRKLSRSRVQSDIMVVCCRIALNSARSRNDPAQTPQCGSYPQTVSHDTALAWAEDQYDAFAERRRQSAEEVAALSYDEDLAAVAKQVEALAKPKKRAPKKGSS